MATTLRSYARRAFEERLVMAVRCLDCDQPRGVACLNSAGRPAVVCCGSRAYFGADVLAAEARFRLLLIEHGLLPLDGMGP